MWRFFFFHPPFSCHFLQPFLMCSFKRSFILDLKFLLTCFYLLDRENVLKIFLIYLYWSGMNFFNYFTDFSYLCVKKNSESCRTEHMTFSENWCRWFQQFFSYFIFWPGSSLRWYLITNTSGNWYWIVIDLSMLSLINMIIGVT